MPMLAGKAVVSTGAALVTAEEPVQLRTPIGPSAILIAGMPRRSMGELSIQPEPASMRAFSAAVMRPRRSSTRFSTGSCGFLYCSCACSGFARHSTSDTEHSRASTSARAIVTSQVDRRLQSYCRARTRRSARARAG